MTAHTNAAVILVTAARADRKRMRVAAGKMQGGRRLETDQVAVD